MSLPLQLNAACSNYLEEPQRRNAAVFDNSVINGIPACGGHPVLGSCGGPSLTRQTAYIGTSAGVIEGDVVAATYTVQAAVDGLSPLSFTYTQNWTIDAENQGCDTPDRFGVFSTFLTDEDGRNVNAAGVGVPFTWPIDFWIEFYEPEPRQGDPPFYAGGGRWWAVCGQDLGLAVTNSGTATPPDLRSTDQLLPDLCHPRVRSRRQRAVGSRHQFHLLRQRDAGEPPAQRPCQRCLGHPARDHRLRARCGRAHPGGDPRPTARHQLSDRAAGVCGADGGGPGP